MSSLCVAVDIDGTITRYPSVFKEILDAFPYAVILTGCLSDDPSSTNHDHLVSGRVQQLTPLIGVPRHEIIVCVGRTVADVANGKGLVCKQRGVSLFIDDSKVYCEAVRKISPSTAIIQVFE